MRAIHAVVILAIFLCVGLAGDYLTGYDTATVRIDSEEDSTTITPTAADSLVEQYRGLSGREQIPKDGMLFVFRTERNHTMVMRGMKVGLDMVFIDSQGRVVAVEERIPADSSVEYSHRSKYVLELPSGFASKYGITEQTVVEISLGRSAAGGSNAER